MNATIQPITNKLISGTAVVDVVLVDGRLTVRLIDYRPATRGESMIQSPSDIDLDEYPKYIQKAVKASFQYCEYLATKFSTENLSDDALTLLAHIKSDSKPVFTYKRIVEADVIAAESIQPALDALQNQFKLHGHTSKYYYNKEFDDIQASYVEDKNKHWLD